MRQSRQQHNRQLKRNHPDKRTDGDVLAEQQQQESSVRSAELRSRSLYRLGHGDVPVVRWQRASSARNAEPRNRRKTDGHVPAEALIKANSVRSAGQRNLQVFRCTGVINAAGNRKIRRIRRNSVRNAEIRLMMAILHSNVCFTQHPGLNVIDSAPGVFG